MGQGKAVLIGPAIIGAGILLIFGPIAGTIMMLFFGITALWYLPIFLVLVNLPRIRKREEAYMPSFLWIFLCANFLHLLLAGMVETGLCCNQRNFYNGIFLWIAAANFCAFTFWLSIQNGDTIASKIISLRKNHK